MTAKTKAQLQSDITSKFPTQGKGQITAAVLRSYEIDLTDSMAFSSTVSISVMDYGAVGNGVVDDTAAIQTAIDANPGREIRLPSTGAFYAISDELVILSSGTSLVGEACGGHLFGAAADLGGSTIKWVGATSLSKGVLRVGDPSGMSTYGGVVRNLQLDANLRAAYCLYPRAACNYEFSNLVLKGATSVAFYPAPKDTGNLDLAHGMFNCSCDNIMIRVYGGADGLRTIDTAENHHPAFCSFNNLHITTEHGICINLREMDDCTFTNVVATKTGTGADAILLDGRGVNGNYFWGTHASGGAIRSTNQAQANYMVVTGIDYFIEPVIDAGSELFYVYTGRNVTTPPGNLGRQKVPVTQFPNIERNDPLALDWYEEVYFDDTLGVTFENPGNLSVAYTICKGRGTRVGDRVEVTISLSFVPTYTSATGLFKITGIPWPTNSEADMSSTLAVGFNSGFAFPGTTTSVCCVAPPNSGHFILRCNGSGIGAAVDLTNVHIVSGNTIGLRISGNYRV